MKLSIVIAAQNALPSAFVVWRGFEKSFIKAAEYGFHGVELALRSAEEFERENIEALLKKSGMAVSCISTGQVFAADGLSFTDPSPAVREETIRRYRGFIQLAGVHGGFVNIGRARGSVAPGQSREETEQRFMQGLAQLLPEAEALGVCLLIEPVNRYEINYINSVDEAAALVKRMGSKSMGIMPDLFHMNIEDDDIQKSLTRNIEHIRYVHFADSNRCYPGCGHIDFASVVGTLNQLAYKGWCSVEIQPLPSPDMAALNAAKALLPLLTERSEQA